MNCRIYRFGVALSDQRKNHGSACKPVFVPAGLRFRARQPALVSVASIVRRSVAVGNCAFQRTPATVHLRRLLLALAQRNLAGNPMDYFPQFDLRRRVAPRRAAQLAVSRHAVASAGHGRGGRSATTATTSITFQQVQDISCQFARSFQSCNRRIKLDRVASASSPERGHGWFKSRVQLHQQALNPALPGSRTTPDAGQATNDAVRPVPGRGCPTATHSH